MSTLRRSCPSDAVLQPIRVSTTAREWPKVILMASTRSGAEKKRAKDKKRRPRQPSDVGVLAVTPAARRGGRTVGRSRTAFSEAKAKRHAENSEPLPSFLPAGPVKV